MRRKPSRAQQARNEKFRRAYHSAERVEWIWAHPSVVSGKIPCENVHVETGGMGRKAGFELIVPLTAREHSELHRHGIKTFEQRHGVDLAAEAARIQREWVIFSEKIHDLPF